MANTENTKEIEARLLKEIYELLEELTGSEVWIDGVNCLPDMDKMKVEVRSLLGEDLS